MNQTSLKQRIADALTDMGVKVASNGELECSKKAKWWAMEGLATELAVRLSRGCEPPQSPLRPQGQSKRNNEATADKETEGDNQQSRSGQQHNCCSCYAVSMLKYLIKLARETSGAGVWLSLFVHMLDTIEKDEESNER